MLHTIKSKTSEHIRRIRKRGDAEKKRIVTIVSVCVTLFVLGLWVLYLNISLPSFVNPQEQATIAQTLPENKNAEGALNTFSRGFETIFQGIKNGFKSFAQSVQTKNEFSLKSESSRYVPPEADVTPSTKLP